jgi:hypothetical protein
MIPFSAERGNLQQPISSKPHFPQGSATPTSFEYLVSELGKFATAQKAQNLIPTDQILQEKARLIVYGDNDPWNQTAADNSQWLELFKEGYGIADPAPSDTGQAGLPPFVAADSSHFPENLNLPWYWQSPECLAIYRQNKASFYAHHGSVCPPDGVAGAPEGLPRAFDNPNEQHEQDLSFLALGDDWSHYIEDYTQDPLGPIDQFVDDPFQA